MSRELEVKLRRLMDWAEKGPELTHNDMAEVRQELKRRGLREPFVQSVRCRIGILPGLPDTLDVFELIDAPLEVQLAAAVEVMERKP